MVEETHCYVHHIPNLQIIIENGGIVKCGGWCENMKLQMGDHHHKTHIFSIEMGGCNVVLQGRMDKEFGIDHHHGFQGTIYKIF